MGSPLSVYQHVGVDLGLECYDPEPDVVVINDAESPDGRYAGRFYLVAEVLSESDDRRQAKKMSAYRRHPHCRRILLIQQEHAEIAYHWRDQTTWWLTLLAGRDDVLRIDEFGLACPLSRIYDRVKLL
jgi:Uma2 family endonuclease